MTVDVAKGFSLPSGPSSLCFDKEEFMKVKKLNRKEYNKPRIIVYIMPITLYELWKLMKQLRIINRTKPN